VLGARRIHEHVGARTRWWVIQDPYGNEFCVTTVQSASPRAAVAPQTLPRIDDSRDGAPVS